MKQTAVEYIKEKLFCNEYWYENMTFEQIFEQAEAMDRSQKAEEYLKGFKDGKEYQIKLDELTFKSE